VHSWQNLQKIIEFERGFSVKSILTYFAMAVVTKKKKFFDIFQGDRQGFILFPNSIEKKCGNYFLGGQANK
jgi:hypothetical protein